MVQELDEIDYLSMHLLLRCKNRLTAATKMRYQSVKPIHSTEAHKSFGEGVANRFGRSIGAQKAPTNRPSFNCLLENGTLTMAQLSCTY